MSRNIACYSIAGIAALAFVAMPLVTSADEPSIQVNPISVERGEFTDEVDITIKLKPEGAPRTQVIEPGSSHLVMAEVIVKPDGVFPWHTHPASSISIIDEGELMYVTEDCDERLYTTGTAMVDPGDNVHTAYNPSDTEDLVLLATFIGAPAEGPLTLPIDAEESEALDDQCGIER